MYPTIIAIILLSLVASVTAAPHESELDLRKRYSADPSSSVFLKYAYEHSNFSTDISIKYHVVFDDQEGDSLSAPLDTGSVGAAIGSHHFPNWTYFADQIAQGPPGHIMYSSDGLLLTGHFADVTIVFEGGTLPLTANASVLVVNQTVTCMTSDLVYQHYCPEDQIDRSQPGCFGSDCNTSYFGIGWARGTNSQSNNPFLSIASIDDRPLPDEYTFGYAITDIGVHVGLNEENTADFTMVDLTRQSGNMFDWSQVSGCLQFTATDQTTPGPCVPSKFLLDTGIPQGFATVNSDNQVTGFGFHRDGTPRTGQDITTGWTVTARFGDSTDADKYDFTFTMGEEGQKYPVAPSWLGTTLNDTVEPSLNTGRHFFRINDMMYDATNGRWGGRLRYGSQVVSSSSSAASTIPPTTSGTLVSVPGSRTAGPTAASFSGSSPASVLPTSIASAGESPQSSSSTSGSSGDPAAGSSDVVSSGREGSQSPPGSGNAAGGSASGSGNSQGSVGSGTGGSSGTAGGSSGSFMAGGAGSGDSQPYGGSDSMGSNGGGQSHQDC